MNEHVEQKIIDALEKLAEDIMSASFSSADPTQTSEATLWHDRGRAQGAKEALSVFRSTVREIRRSAEK